MNHTRPLPGMFLMAALSASSAFGQVQRTFVSGLGSDSNPCSRTAPCRTFTQAISQTNAGGEVYALDTAGYGPFSVNKSISIVAPLGVTAGISVFSGNGITINAGGSDTVILRGLTLNNQGSNGIGIFFQTGGTLHVESCVVNGFTAGDGVDFQGAGNLEVKDSIMRGNLFGIVVLPSSGQALAAIDQVRLEGNSFAGLLAEDGAFVTVRNSVASANRIGFYALSANSAAAEVNIESCVVSNNGTGVQSDGGSTGVATVRVSNSTVTRNGTGLANAGTLESVLLSRGNNTVEGNTMNTSGIIGSYTAK